MAEDTVNSSRDIIPNIIIIVPEPQADLGV